MNNDGPRAAGPSRGAVPQASSPAALSVVDGMAPGREDSDVRVAVFTTELFGNHYPPSFTRELLEGCARLARRFPGCRFQVKAKDPETVDALQADSRFKDLCASVSRNFRLLRLDRYACAPLLAESDIVIAAGFTTPGSDALLQGKRTIFYSKLRGAGQPFSGLPDLIAETPEQLEQLFETALSDYRDYSRRHKQALDALDPFRDGQARQRALDVLLAPQEGEAEGMLR